MSFLLTRLAVAAQPEPSLTFEANVRPILKANCFHCHGEEQKKEGGLDVRLVRFLEKGGESGPAIIARKRGESLLMQRITSGEMPPGEKKLSAKDVETLGLWIDQGAGTVRPEPESLTDEEFTEEERSFWAFQPLRKPPMPDVQAPSHLQSPIDTFLLARLEQANLAPSAPASAHVLLRRAKFDLIGLPPTVDEQDQYFADPAPDSYDRLLDRLLASPGYAERWARHWLDVAGYADSDGYGEKDVERKYAYKYRDYIIRNLMADRPWNELIVEQLAGDELLAPPYQNLTADQADKLVATGFLRMGPDGTSDSASDAKIAANDCLAETIKIVSTSFLGLSVGCAQCHVHRYDPISQKDYYRMRAIFEPAYDWTNWRTPSNRLVSLWTDEQRTQAADCDAEVKRLEKERTSKYEELIEQVREKEIAELPDDVKQRIREAAKLPDAKRTEEQKQLLADHPKANIPIGLLDRNAPKEHKEITERYAKQIDEVKSKRPADDFAMALTEVAGRVPKTFLFFRGEINQPKEEVTPATLAIIGGANANPLPLDDDAVATTGRRLAFAKQLTNGRHPLVTRVLMNRVWMDHFGRGLVATPADFGHLGERPTHAELLDWLASQFVEDGWTLKETHRRLMLSAAYQQSSSRRSELDAVDPENRLLGRMNVRRLDAETVRDALLVTSGAIVEKLYGPSVPVTPDEAGIVIVGVDTRDSAGRPTGKVVPLHGEEFRRSVYIQVRRSMPLAMIDTFDGATLNPNCVVRTSSTVAPQSLMMMNNDFIVEQSIAFTHRLLTGGGEDSDHVKRAWRIAFGTEPTPSQLTSSILFLDEQTKLIEAQPVSTPANNAGKAKKNAKTGELPKLPETARERALAHFCHALLVSNPFLYVD